MPSAKIGDATIHYREAGSGNRVFLLLHAFPLHSGMWEPLLPVLAKEGWRVIAPDARGFGKSTPGPDVLGMDVIAGDAAALLESLGVKKAVIGGLSMGGYAAFELWRRRKDLVRALFLADTKAAADTAEGAAGRETFAKNAVANGIAWVAAELAPKLQRPERVASADLAIRTMIAEAAPAAVAAGARGLAKRVDSTPSLATIDVPVRIVVGAADALTPPAEAKTMNDGIRGSTLVEIPKAGHISNLEDPIAFADALVPWLDASSP